MYLPELEICWQCGGDGTIDIDYCEGCEMKQHHYDCTPFTVEKTILCPVCQNPDDQDFSGLPLETV